MKNWISVDKKLPKKKESGYSEYVLLYLLDGTMMINCYDYGWNLWFEHHAHDPIYWMPLPDPPNTHK